MKQTKKGFTLVELLVVIAILAILTTVSVVGYTSFIEKANRSVDEQAVAQMNMALLAADIPAGSITGIAQVQELLDECNLEIEDYKPLSKERFFFYDSSLNRIVYTDNNYNVLYPQELADDINKESWFSLSGEIQEVTIDTWVDTHADTNIVTVTIEGELAAERLYTFAKNIKKYDGKEIVINITGDVNMKGAALVFADVTGDFTLNGVGANGVVISNIGQTDANIGVLNNNKEGDLMAYGAGLIPKVKNGVKNITFNGITLKNSSFGFETGTSIGAFVGQALGASDLESITFTNCAVVGCTISANYRAGAFIGQTTWGHTITFSGCKVENTTITTERGWGGKIMGFVSDTDTTLLVGVKDEVEITNCTVVYNNGSLYKSDPYGTDGSKTDALYFQHNSDDTYSIVK